MGRIGLSVLLGFLIGLERQITGHPAGIRINVLISMGACLFLMFPLMSGSDEVYRIASYIVSGVGFLCGGVIFKEGGTVRGLNTASNSLVYGRCRCTVQFRQLSFCGCRSGYSDSFKSAVPAAGGKDQAHYLR
ncbi:MAG: MgtC/SapB family protein [Flavonifractor plautii]